MNTNLELKFDMRTIEHLGIKMYSRLPNALAELVANAFDADAKVVNIHFFDETEKKIIVQDNGLGMSFEEINDKFLVIGRKRRNDDSKRETDFGRKITGKKGLGKLALFGIAKTIEIVTKKRGESSATVFKLNWDDILNSEGSYNPTYYKIEKDKDFQGTQITLSSLERTTGFNIEDISISLSKLFNFFNNDFKVFLYTNSDKSPKEVTKELKYTRIEKEFEWDIVDLVNSIESTYPEKVKLRGRIITSKKPMNQTLRGITLYANGRLVNAQGFFDVSEGPVAFSYMSGWIDADFLDELPKDVISTDRQSLNWDMDDTKSLLSFLQNLMRKLVTKWNIERKSKKLSETKKNLNIESWCNTMPDDMKNKLLNVIEKVSNKLEVDGTETKQIVDSLHSLIPEYPLYHFRHINPSIQKVSKSFYESKNYYTAFIEAIKFYVNAVESKSGKNIREDFKLMGAAFGEEKEPLKTTERFKKRPNGTNFSEDTLKSIERGQKHLSMGIVAGGRNPLSHEVCEDLRITGLFTESDCLDLLSLLSHLTKRLEESQKINFDD